MKVYILTLFLLLNIPLIAQDYSKKWENVNYATDTLSYHNMDIYLPSVEKSSYPVIVYIYGSAWLSNSSKGADMNTIGKSLLDAGFAVVTPNHRASWNALFPAQIHDVKAVIRYIRANAEKYRLDTSFIGISGSSSGGNLAAMAGVTRNVKSFTLEGQEVDLEGEVGKYLDFCSSVDAVVAWFPPTNMLIMDSCGGTDFIHDDVNSPASRYIGGAIQENQTKTLLASPTTYASPNSPPFLIFHGNNDRVVPHCQSEVLYEALNDAGADSELVIVENGGHGPGVHEEEYINMMVDFFLQAYKN
ncbi:alpha/beta hydrolase [Natronoflexus pectinivorans]|uniref:Acetyl esterase/lipase n=1 Tax=Natronoflexus pectinivorans TaxID=682526 RepID=A0A4R2GN12_9BACT|nr:alpha/beta hydrolase [Natronoflexus pectinivorans]TCO10665.1 acetyl esterase/lipase [Natronoflexus pectinivorans]